MQGDRTLDLTFVPEEFGEVHAVALAGGVLFVGVQLPARRPTPMVRALDATTGSVLPTTFAPPADARNVSALVADGGRLYVAFDSGAVAFDAATGSVIWSHATGLLFDGHPSGPATLALDGAHLLVGGRFSDAGNENLEALDSSTGAPTGPSFNVPTAVSSIAVVGDKVYVARARQSAPRRAST